MRKLITIKRSQQQGYGGAATYTQIGNMTQNLNCSYFLWMWNGRNINTLPVDRANIGNMQALHNNWVSSGEQPIFVGEAKQCPEQYAEVTVKPWGDNNASAPAVLDNLLKKQFGPNLEIVPALTTM